MRMKGTEVKISELSYLLETTPNNVIDNFRRIKKWWFCARKGQTMFNDNVFDISAFILTVQYDEARKNKDKTNLNAMWPAQAWYVAPDRTRRRSRRPSRASFLGPGPRVQSGSLSSPGRPANSLSRCSPPRSARRSSSAWSRRSRLSTQRTARTCTRSTKTRTAPSGTRKRNEYTFFYLCLILVRRRCQNVTIFMNV